MIAETGGEAVGYALFREMFNIDSGRPGLHMMDLFVQPEHRRGGAGRALLAALAARCLAIDGGWITWQCLERNTGAMAFYQAIGGRRFACADFELAGDALGARVRERGLLDVWKVAQAARAALVGHLRLP